jgi:hypothetical protein
MPILTRGSGNRFEQVCAPKSVVPSTAGATSSVWRLVAEGYGRVTIRFLDDRLSRLEQLVREHATLNPGVGPETVAKETKRYLTAELKDSTRQVFEACARSRSYRDVEMRLVDSVAIDFEAIDAGLEKLALAQIAGTGVAETPAGNPTQTIADTRELFARTKSIAATISPLELQLRVAMALDTWGFDTLLSQPRSNETPIDELQGLVRTKLTNISDEEMAQFWARIGREFEPYRISLDPTLLPPDFLVVKQGDDLRDRVALYLVKVRPDVIRQMGERDVQGVPLNPIGIGSVLSWKSRPTHKWSTLEETLITALWRVAQFWKNHPSASQHEDSFFRQLSSILEVGPNSRLLDRDSEDEAELPQQDFRLVVHELRTLVRAVDEQSLLPSPLHDLLWRFKLALEVLNPDGRERFADKNEIYLQKVLCEYLVRAGAFAVGTKFGAAESDVVAKYGHDLMVIEAKRVTRKPTANDLAKWLVQLKNYMSQSPLRIRGVLVLFNLGDFLLDAEPGLRVAGNCSVLVINLLGLVPSALKQSHEIRVVDDPQRPFEVVTVSQAKPAHK